ncbi:MAG: HYR domain-containing protein [Bacteroidetes bacterium]|nr:HYR domain-containing protein [Bacteroidota bacterium]
MAVSCSENQSIVVEDPPLLTSSCSATDATCFGHSDGSASVIATGGRGIYTYLWSNSTNSTSNPNIPSGTYTVTVTDGNGCTSECVTIVSEPQIVSANISGSDVNCINDVTTITVVGTGGTAPYTGEGSFSVGVGTHVYPIVDNIGCTGSASITINHLDVDPPVILDCPANITQCESTVNWVAPTASDNCTLVSFTSNFNSGSTFSVGTTQVIYTATDNAGLISTCSFDVTIVPTPVWYEDQDVDGFGNPLVSITDCIQPIGYTSDNSDCDDTQILYADLDNDTYGAGAPVACGVSSNNDCDDNNAAVNPGATEVCNGIDDDCNGLSDDGLVFLDYYVDADGDGFGAGAATSSCNPIVGSVLVDGDCDDNNAAVNPGASEICNGIDDDCNGLSDDGLVFLDYYVDADGDGFGAGVATSSCNPIVGSVLVDGDCDDNNAAVNPSATEVCNLIDDDCDGLIDEGVLLTFYADVDGDGFGDASSTTQACSAPVGYVTDNTDCDDNNAAVNPSATEICNGIDDDCNGLSDDGLVFLDYYVDADGDGFGAGAATSSCNPIVGSVLVDGDCDDNNAAVNPGATEICNGIDDDCNGLSDDGLIFLDYYVDADGDGFGTGVATSSCSPIVGSVLVNGDCDDNNAAVNPSATEICNLIDDDCDGLIDEGVLLTFYADVDGDGFGDALSSTQACSAPVGYVTDNTDCDDNNAAVNPGATEVCNSIDDDCDGLIDEGVLLTFYADVDGDGFGDALSSTQACSAPVGYVTDNTDCDDNNAAVNPAATEVCNSIDDDCDGLIDEGVLLTFYADVDGDGFGDAFSTTQACSAPVGYLTDNTDCDDNNAAVNPSATEICNLIDDDCDGLIDEGVLLTFYADVDGDGFGDASSTTQACSAPVGYVTDNTDCDDNNAAVNPSATEICNGIDDDCNGLSDDGLVFLDYYVDADGDGFGAGAATSSCNPIVGSVLVDGDCDDNNAAVNPGATEICNGIDDDCNGLSDDGLVFLDYYVDADGDGFGAGLATSSCNPIVGSVLVDGDCDDNNAAVNPGASEICNGIDDDCNGLSDDGLVFLDYYVDADGDGFGAGVATSSCNPIVGSVLVDGDCDDNNAAVNPGATEVCNGIDDDCNGLSDDGLVFLDYYVDADGDGFGAGVATSSCSPIVGSVLVDGDCDDNNAAVNPSATEICNLIDDDCDGLIDEGVLLTFNADVDGDGFGDASSTTQACSAPVGYVADNTDCDDNNAAVNPSATEICNGIDDDCNGLSDDGLVFLDYYVDADGDGFGAGAATSSCSPIIGSVLVDGDC